MSDTEDLEDLESKVGGSIRDRLESQEPSEQEKEALRKTHNGHLVRDTTSTLTVDDVPAMVEAKAKIPDTYCFTCEEWIGLSGIELAGTPRSKTDSYYLGGPPKAIRELRDVTRRKITDFCELIIASHPYIDSPERAAEFISDEIEQIQDRLVTQEKNCNTRSVGAESGSE